MLSWLTRAYRLSGLLTARFLLLLRAQRPFKPTARLGHEDPEANSPSASAQEESEVAVAVAATGLSSVWDEFGDDPASPVSPIRERKGSAGSTAVEGRDGERANLETIEEEHSRDRRFPEFVVGSSSFRGSEAV